MRYFIYARKSSESEDRQVQSIDDQLKALRELAERLFLNVVGELTEARSAKAPGLRPVFADLLQRIQTGEADGILCWSTNRLFRNSVDYGQVAWFLQQATIKSIRTVDREYLPEDNVLLMAVEAGVATQFVIDLKKAVIRGMESKASKGWFPGKAPPGYFKNKTTREIGVDETEHDLIRRGWTLLLSGAYTVPQVQEQMNSWGLRKMARSNVYNLFSNPFYYGSFLYRGAFYPGNHKPMVTKDEFDRVQAIIHRTDHIQPQEHEFAFTGLIRCGICGCMVTAERRVKNYPTTGNTRVYVYYHCTGSKGCSKSAVREEYVEEQIQLQLDACGIDEQTVGALEAIARRHDLDEPASQVAIEDQQRRALAAARQKLDRLLELRLAGEIDAEEFQAHRSESQGEIAKLEAAFQQLATKSARDQMTLENCIHFAANAYRDFAGGSVKTKRAIATALSDSYLLTLGKLAIEPHPLLDRMRAFEPPKSPPQQIGAGDSASLNPLWCAWLDNIRTLVTGSSMRFVDYTALGESAKEPETNKTPVFRSCGLPSYPSGTAVVPERPVRKSLHKSRSDNTARYQRHFPCPQDFHMDEVQ